MATGLIGSRGSGRRYRSKTAFYPGPIHNPTVHYRDPIRGVSANYSQLPQFSSSKRSQSSQFHRATHDASVFENTKGHRSFFIIHPDWTSEASGTRRVMAKERGHYDWANRPSHPPLSDYLLPLIEKRKQRESATYQAERQASRMGSRMESIQENRLSDSGKAFSPKDTSGQSLRYSIY